MRAVFTLTSTESKRLIAKAISQLPEVLSALEEGRVIIAGGTTNAYIAEELINEEIDKAAYSVGIISNGRQCLTPEGKRTPPLTLENGQVSTVPWVDHLDNFTSQDVFIKGGNALDYEGNVGVLMASPVGGTIAKALSITAARGSHLLLPVGLEKLIPDVIEAANAAGSQTFQRRIGMAVGLMPVSYGRVITELIALNYLTGAKATCIAAGGIGGSEGSLVIAVEGENEQIDGAMELIKAIKNEKNIPPFKRSCEDCENKCELPLEEELN